MTPEQRSLRSRIAAYAALSRNDPREINAKARRVYRDSFRNGHRCVVCPVFVMPEGLSPAEVDRRADALRKAHFGRLALKSSRVRSEKAAVQT
jgi:hypothetical protein